MKGKKSAKNLQFYFKYIIVADCKQSYYFVKFTYKTAHIGSESHKNAVSLFPEIIPKRIQTIMKMTMKKICMILLLIIATATGWAQTETGNDAKSNGIADTYWRNEQTGDWLIGFAPKHVVYQPQAAGVIGVEVEG